MHHEPATQFGPESTLTVSTQARASATIMAQEQRPPAGALGPRLAGRLTAELILRSRQYMSCVQQYEIDLRGNKIAAIENLGATGEHFDHQGSHAEPDAPHGRREPVRQHRPFRQRCVQAGRFPPHAAIEATPAQQQPHLQNSEEARGCAGQGVQPPILGAIFFRNRAMDLNCSICWSRTSTKPGHAHLDEQQAKQPGGGSSMQLHAHDWPPS